MEDFKDYNYRQRQKIILGSMDKLEKIAWLIFLVTTVTGVVMLSVLY